MIISHENRYIFIEIPLTASWAIRHELCEYYGGKPILHKHASYPEFERFASPAQKDFFTFATVRHPLDMAVSSYFKFKTNHKGVFTDPLALEAGMVEKADIAKFRFVQEENADFDAFFCRYYRRPYGSMIDHSASNLDYVIRYESLQQDFSEVLHRLKLDQIRPIPVRNKTQIRKSGWQTYYGPASIELAKSRFGPFMRRWGYDFPSEWGPVQSNAWEDFKYKSLDQVRRLYLSKIRYNSGLTGRVLRKARAALVR